MERKKSTFGLIFLGLGVLTLLNNLDIINLGFGMWQLWPLALIIPGLVFEMTYFNTRNKKNAGLLVPGGILLTYGLIFSICTLFGYGHMVYLWPLFLGGVGIGLFQLYCFGEKEKPLFWVSVSFIAFAVISMFITLITMKGSMFVPLFFFLLAFLLLKGKQNRDRDDYSDQYNYDRDYESDFDIED